MPLYHVVAQEVQYYFVQVEAADPEAAKEAASFYDAQDFEYMDGGDWEIIDAVLVPEPKKDLSKSQLNLFQEEPKNDALPDHGEIGQLSPL